MANRIVRPFCVRTKRTSYLFRFCSITLQYLKRCDIALRKLLGLPHRVCESTCYVNGLEDILAWKGAEYSDFLLSVIGGMAGFAYFRFKRADPPCMVYWGANPKYLIKDLTNIIGFKEILLEGKTFKNTFPKLKEFVDNGQPVVAGALDIYYLHYYAGLYEKHHMPIHYVLVIGYDDKERVIFVQDCSLKGIQSISYEEFEKSLDVNVPRMSKKNTIRSFAIPQKLPSEFIIARKGFSYKAERFLKPPVRLFGLPAMRKLAEEIFEWNNKKCFEHMVTYATAPPLLSETFENSHGMQFWQADVLSKLGSKYKMKNWTEAALFFRQSGNRITKLCEAALKQAKQKVSQLLTEIANIEERAYAMLRI
jgi:hypothetical protein